MWACSGWGLFVVLYFIGFYSSIDWYFICLQFFRVFMFILLCGDIPLVGDLFYVCMVFAFLVKILMFIVHLWLPMSHVEAPVSGSTILAGVLLKLRGYGFLRVFHVLFKFGFRFSVVWFVLSLVGGLLVSLFCIRQADLKSLLAYSSVAHMRIVIGGIITLSYWAVCRSFALMVAQVLCSSILFCLSNISYERFGRQSFN